MTDERAAAPLLTLAESRQGPGVVLAVTGEIDVATGPQLRTALADVLAVPDVDPVVVDLTGVTFMGSTGIAVLVDANWEAGERSKNLRLVLGSSVRRPLEAAGVVSLIAEYPDVAHALGAPGA